MANTPKPADSSLIADEPIRAVATKGSQGNVLRAEKNMQTPSINQATYSIGSYGKILKVLLDPNIEISVSLSKPFTTVEYRKTELNKKVADLLKISEQTSNVNTVMVEIDANIKLLGQNPRDTSAMQYMQMYKDRLEKLQPTALQRMDERSKLQTEVKELIATKDQLFKTIDQAPPAKAAESFSALINKANELQLKLNNLDGNELAILHDLGKLQRESGQSKQVALSNQNQAPQLGSF